MFEKINVSVVIGDHLRTFEDFGTGKRSMTDYFIMLGLPLVIAAVLLWQHGALAETPITILAASLSIFAALLFNLLLLIYDAIPKPERRHRKDLLRQVFSNVSFAILTSVITLILLLVLSLMSSSLLKDAMSAIVFYMSTLFLLTLFMILKRVHILIGKEFEPIEEVNSEVGELTDL